MRTITTQTDVYAFNELSAEAKENVKKWWIDGNIDLSYIFTEDIEQHLNELFPNSDLKIQYSLSYCQGDGLNIYGELYLFDILELLKTENKLSDKEYKSISFYLEHSFSSIKLSSNNHYNYCICDRLDFASDLIDELEYQDYRNVNYQLVKKFEQLIGDKLGELCKEYEKQGYIYFYEISDEDMQNLCDSNEYEFTEDGNIF